MVSGVVSVVSGVVLTFSTILLLLLVLINKGDENQFASLNVKKLPDPGF